jgi:hydroxymethylpyrimidine pyrophosphatase-like HAD family hydrolase
MLINAGYSVAMGNSSECVKEHATYVTDDIDNDGLSKAITKILSLKE